MRSLIHRGSRATRSPLLHSPSGGAVSQHTGGTHVEACGRSPRNGSNRSLGWSQRWFDSTAEHMDADEEIWAPLPAAPTLYEISSHGRARRSAPSTSGRTYVGKPLKAHPNSKTGYMMIHPFIDGRLKGFSVHRQVCIAFHGQPDPGMHARHLDDDPMNNRADNLAWGTPKQNAADARRNGIGRPSRRGKTHCKRDHEYTEENTRIGSGGYRVCRTCVREYQSRA